MRATSSIGLRAHNMAALEDPDAPVAPSAPEDAPKVHPRARRLSVSKAQPAPMPPAEAQSLPEFNTNHVFEVHDGQASVCVNDTLELRAAFLKYCNSSMRPTEMHRVASPHMKAPNFISMCKDLNIVEPQGPLSLMVVGITYATLKADDSEGLTYAQFLDSLMELAFEGGTNVAGQLQSQYAGLVRPVPPRPTGLLRSDSSLRSRSSEPGTLPQPPPQPRASEFGGLGGPVTAASPEKPRSLQPRFSESGGRFQRSNSLFRSLPGPLEGSSGSGSILSQSLTAVQLEQELRSSASVGSDGIKVPRPPPSLLRTSISGAALSRPAFRPSIAQRPLKARNPAQVAAALADEAQEDCIPAGAFSNSNTHHQHPLHSSVMNSWSGGADDGECVPGQPRGSPLSRISAIFQAPDGSIEEPHSSPLSHVSAMFQVPDAGVEETRGSPLSRISAKFQAPDAGGDESRSSPLSRVSALFQAPDADDDDDDADALFKSSRRVAQSTGVSGGTPATFGVMAETGVRPPSVRSSLVLNGRPPSASSPLSRTSVNGQIRPPSATPRH